MEDFPADFYVYFSPREKHKPSPSYSYAGTEEESPLKWKNGAVNSSKHATQSSFTLRYGHRNPQEKNKLFSLYSGKLVWLITRAAWHGYVRVGGILFCFLVSPLGRNKCKNQLFRTSPRSKSKWGPMWPVKGRFCVIYESICKYI